jgi:hypothetical protein
MATVTVVPPYQVCHEGTVYGPGATAEVPDWLAQHWRALGYVEVAKATKKGKDSPPELSVPDSGG